MPALAISFNRDGIVQYWDAFPSDTGIMTGNKTGKDAMIDAHSTAAKKPAPASGCFGFTHQHLLPPRPCDMDAELFARFYSDPGTADLVRNAKPKPR